MEQVDLGYTRLEIGAGSMLVRTGEGVDVTVELHQAMIDEVEKRIAGDYGIVFDEISSYSIRFGVLAAMKQNLRLKCLAFVAYRPTTYEIAEIADACIEKPIQIFADTKTAYSWVARQLLQPVY
jgi:hypothetical protein